MINTFLKKADENLPEIYEKRIDLQVGSKEFEKGDSMVIDMGNHYVGYFSFTLNCLENYLDAPVRLYIKLCETERELEDDFNAYNGWICSTWLQQEYINLDNPIEYTLPRRYAARYIYIECVGTPQRFSLSDFSFTAVSSADENLLCDASTDDEYLRRIDAVSANTLKNCMHRVFEDGPKRDRRLWIGDLRLEALANYYTFNNLSLVRRCLYLFAAAPITESGFVPNHLYEYPALVASKGAMVDYSLLYVASVCDYYEHTGDKELLNELFDIIKGQMDNYDRCIGSDGIVSLPERCGAFIDWCPGLEKTIAIHGVYLYVLKNFIAVLSSVGYDESVYRERYDKAVKTALDMFYDSDKNAFVCSADGYQYSVHSAVWMILGGVVEGEAAEAILADVLSSADSVKPFTPYMHHYVAEAFASLGMIDEMKDYIKNYWGKMVDEGADTFYEVFVPGNPDFSPYDDRKINSMCHAWSCTPSYFIRKYLTGCKISADRL